MIPSSVQLLLLISSFVPPFWFGPTLMTPSIVLPTWCIKWLNDSDAEIRDRFPRGLACVPVGFVDLVSILSVAAPCDGLAEGAARKLILPKAADES